MGRKDAEGFYCFYFKVGDEQWMLNLFAFHPDELLSTEGPTIIQQKLDARLADQDNPD